MPKISDKTAYPTFFFCISLLFLITRLANLKILPIFNDEAIYIRYSMLINEDIRNILIPIQVENKKPLLMWLITVALNIFQDPLWAARFVSVVSGFFSLLGIILIGCRLHSLWSGCIAGLLYTFSPYHLFYDRMAHHDSLLNCFFLWLVWMTLVMFQSKQIKEKYYWLLGLIIGLSFLSKTTALLFVFLPLFLYLFLWKNSAIVAWKLLIVSYGSGLIISVLPYVSILLASQDISIKNILFPPQTTIGQANISNIFLNIPDRLLEISNVIDYFTVYLTIPVVFAAFIFSIFQFRTFNKSYFIVLIFFIIPFFLTICFAGSGFSRYFLFSGSLVLLWASLAIVETFDLIRRHVSQNVCYGVIILTGSIILYPLLAFDYKLLVKPTVAPFIGRDYDQYISGEFSGYGNLEAINYFKKVSGKKKIVVFTTWNWGNPGDAIHIYANDYSNIYVYSANWAFEKRLLPSANLVKINNIYQKYTNKNLGSLLIDDTSDVYFICSSTEFSREQFLGINNNFHLIRSFRKPESIVSVDIYKRVL